MVLIFTLRHASVKTHENHVYAHHLFVAYKTTFDQTVGERIFYAMPELGFPENS